MTDREKIVFVARACIGTKEHTPEHKTILDIYNEYKGVKNIYKMKDNDPWCAAFVSAVFIAAGLDKAIPIDCSCFYMQNRAIANGLMRNKAVYVPRAGDVIFYKWQDKKVVSHVGIVESVEGSRLSVIEGNFKDRVDRREIRLSYPYIDSYMTPKDI